MTIENTFSREDIFRLLVESVQDYAIFVLDAGGHVATWNPGAQRMKKYARADIIGRHFSIFYPEAEVAAGKPARALDVAAREGRFEDEGYRVRGDGSTFWANVVISALRDESGELVGFAKVTRDLTERRRAEEEARRFEREQALRIAAEGEARRFAFLAHVSDVLGSSLDYEHTLANVARSAVPQLADRCAVDVAGADGTLRRIVMFAANPAVAGAASSEPVSLTPTEPGPAAAQAARDRRSLLVPELTDEQLRLWFADPKALAAARALGVRSLMVCPMVGDDEVLGVISLGTVESGRRFDSLDLAQAEELARLGAAAVLRARLVGSLEHAHAKLSEQAEELELQTEELQQAMEEYELVNEELSAANETLSDRTREAEAALRSAEEANRAKSEFLANMSHELRTPLNAIAGYAQLIELGVHGPVTEAQRTAIQRIQRNQRHLLVLINDILNFVKLEAGRIPMHLADISLADVLRDLEPLVEPQVRTRELLYACEPPGPELRVNADRERLDQVLLNLVSNAIKFTPSGGRITIRCDREGEAVRIRVADTGIGIPRDKLDSVFEPFVQLTGPARVGQGEGVGLGLAISRDLVRAMGGDLTAESFEGMGSTFTVRLAAAREVPVSETESRSSMQP